MLLVFAGCASLSKDFERPESYAFNDTDSTRPGEVKEGGLETKTKVQYTEYSGLSNIQGVEQKLTLPGHSVYVRPSFGLGTDRPVDGSIEVGYKIVL